MTIVHATIHQLRTNYGDGFLNIENDMPGQLSAWGSYYRHPTYLLIDGIVFYLVTFANREYAAEDLKETARHYRNLWRIDEEGLVKIK